jgi:hypothetical protein
MAIDAPNTSPRIDSDSLFDIIGKHFVPAENPGDATLMLTTDELRAKLEEHAPQEFSAMGLRDAMTELGYQHILLETHFRWLLKER